MQFPYIYCSAESLQNVKTQKTTNKTLTTAQQNFQWSTEFQWRRSRCKCLHNFQTAANFTTHTIQSHTSKLECTTQQSIHNTLPTCIFTSLITYNATMQLTHGVYANQLASTQSFSKSLIFLQGQNWITVAEKYKTISRCSTDDSTESQRQWNQTTTILTVFDRVWVCPRIANDSVIPPTLVQSTNSHSVLINVQTNDTVVYTHSWSPSHCPKVSRRVCLVAAGRQFNLVALLTRRLRSIYSSKSLYVHQLQHSQIALQSRGVSCNAKISYLDSQVYVTLM